MKFFLDFLLLIALVSSHDAKPNLSECSFIGNLFNESGELMKKFCEIRANFNYDQAENNCIQHGMNLLIFNSAQVLEDFSRRVVESREISKLSKVWRENEGYWISGRKNFHGKWFTYTNDYRRPLKSEIPLVDDPRRDCLSLKRNETFILTPFNCSHAFWHFCEFNVMKN